MVRRFDTGATRDTDDGKLDFEGFLSPRVLARFAEYMHLHRRLPDGSMRESDNWQRGMSRSVYLKSGWRHFFDVWANHRGEPAREGIEDAICGVLFNMMGYLHEHLKAKSAEQEVMDATKAAAFQRFMEMQAADDDAPDQNPVSPIGAQSGTDIHQLGVDAE